MTRSLLAGVFLIAAVAVFLYSLEPSTSSGPEPTATPTLIVRGGAVGGVVTWFQGAQREPVRGVELRLLRGTDESQALYTAADANGQFFLQNVPPGNYVLAAAQPDGPLRYEWLVPLLVRSGETRTLALNESNGRQIADPYWR
ncbi:MAG: carboxypeptidase regulatory-like domain-containing protein [Chloroflexi bacterium]|nr:carboxypeptidase regulatory-like domain-containing protein [Chloroflexota bacterium]